MRFVLVGGSGYIGSAVSRKLQSLGHEVINVSRTAKGSAGAKGVSYDHLALMCDGADAVINLAGANIGEKRWSVSRMKELVDSRILPTRAIVEAIGACANRPALISISGVGYYGPTTVPSNEAVGHGNNFPALICAEWEHEALQALSLGERSAPRVVILRMAPILDPKEGPLGRMLPFVKAFIGGPLGSGRQYFPWIHRDDAVDAVIWAATTPSASGPYNIVAPDMVTMKQFAKTLGKVMSRPMFFRVPSIVLLLVFGRLSQVVYTGINAVPSRILGTSFTFRYPRLEGALRDLLGR